MEITRPRSRVCYHQSWESQNRSHNSSFQAAERNGACLLSQTSDNLLLASCANSRCLPKCRVNFGPCPPEIQAREHKKPAARHPRAPLTRIKGSRAGCVPLQGNRDELPAKPAHDLQLRNSVPRSPPPKACAAHAAVTTPLETPKTLKLVLFR